MGKALAFILQSVSLKLLEMSGMDCYVVRSIPENLTGSDDFSNFTAVSLCKDPFQFIPKLWINIFPESSSWLLLSGKNNKH